MIHYTKQRIFIPKPCQILRFQSKIEKALKEEPKELETSYFDLRLDLGSSPTKKIGDSRVFGENLS